MGKRSSDGAVGAEFVNTYSVDPDSGATAGFTQHETVQITRHGFVLVPTPSDDPYDPLVTQSPRSFA